MSSTDEPLKLRRPHPRGATLIGFVVSPRFAIYVACTVAAVVANYLLGKDMMWDTLDYHLYAGFSAIHDRFSEDYFAAGPQSYFNPYIYVPFYLLARSGLPALIASSILAVIQSGVLWLTYEIAVTLASTESPRKRVAIGVCAVAFAFANPILIAEFGSSYCDVTTAELVLAGWLLLVRSVGSPNKWSIVCAGLLLGAVSALKLTNSAHALAAFALLLFLPTVWRDKIRYVAVFAGAIGAGFLLIAAPWAVHLERHFGNPLFPLLNGVFRSPQYSTGSVMDYRFIPDSLREAFWRPFTIAEPVGMVDNEYPSPDLRYAVLLVLGAAAFGRWMWLRLRISRCTSSSTAPPGGTRMLAALGLGFLIDWILWLIVSGNGRYFIAMACVGADLVFVLTFRLFVRRPKARNYLIGAIMCAQVTQLAMGAGYRVYVPWDAGPWFEVAVPRALRTAPGLYLLFGDPSDSFLAPFLPAGSGFINIGGAYELGSEGAAGLRIKSMIRRFNPHLRVVMDDSRNGVIGPAGPPDLTLVNDELGRFGLRADPRDCAGIVVRDTAPIGISAAKPAAIASALPRYTTYLAACHVALAPTAGASLGGERSANLVLDRVEDACPGLFRPRRPPTRNESDRHAKVWAREYPDTGLILYVGSGGRVILRAIVRGAPAEDLGSEREWLRAPPRMQCGRRNERYYMKPLAGKS